MCSATAPKLSLYDFWITIEAVLPLPVWSKVDVKNLGKLPNTRPCLYQDPALEA